MLFKLFLAKKLLDNGDNAIPAFNLKKVFSDISHGIAVVSNRALYVFAVFLAVSYITAPETVLYFIFHIIPVMFLYILFIPYLISGLKRTLGMKKSLRPDNGVIIRDGKNKGNFFIFVVLALMLFFIANNDLLGMGYGVIAILNIRKSN